jgi:predicted ATPase/DNA-binding SARP family transcriptional activator
VDSLRLWLFGTPRAEAAGSAIALNLRPRTLPLLAYILLSPQRTADVRQIAAKLWPDELDEDALANVRRHLYYVRQWLASLGVLPDGVERKSRTVTVTTAVIPFVDVLEFERIAAAGGDALNMLDLYRGDLLEGFDDPWIVTKREALRETLFDVAEREIRSCAAADTPRAIAIAQKALAIDPLREGVVRELMRALDASGDRAGAVREYQRFARLLREEVAAEPSPATVELAATLSAAIAPSRYGLPRAIGTFVGREKALHDLVELCKNARLVTITGTAGVGKTRLATEVARLAEQHFADGVRFIDVTPLNDEHAIARALQTALVPEDRPVVPGDSHAFDDAIRERAYVLVLDGCEHAGPAVAALVQRILQASLRTNVIATSRVPLRVAGEVTWRVDPLDVVTEAPQLFLDRARAARPAINPNRFSKADVCRICGHVDGLPLAIELAAARLRTMTLREVADQLAQRLGAMAQALQWSIDLLSPREREIFYRLSVFRDGFTPESAAAVCECRVDEIIADLADNSLIVPPDPDAPDQRYRMLESIRQPAFKALLQSESGERVQRLHAQHFARQFIALDEDLRHARAGRYFSNLDREYQNVRASLEWLVDLRKDVDAGMKLSLAVSRYWFDRGMIAEARYWLESALEAKSDDALLLARVFQCLATVCRNSGDYAQSFALVGQGVEQLKAGGADAVTLGKAVAVQSNAARILGDFETARRLGYEAIALFEPAGDTYLTAFAHTCIAVTLYGEGRLDEAEAEFERILDAFESCGADSDSALTMTNLGICRLYAGDYDVARARFNAALPRAIALHHRYCEAWTRVGLTMVYALTSQDDAAADELAQVAGIVRAIDDKEAQVGCVEAAALCWSRRFPERAAHALGCAGRARERFHVPRLPVEVPVYEHILERLNGSLTPAALTIALEEGRFIPLHAWFERFEGAAPEAQPS